MAQQSPIQALQQQRLLLQMEYQTEKETYRQQTEAMGMGRKVKRGDAWFPVRVGRTYYNSINQLVIEIFRTRDQEIEHNFEFGKRVQFSSLRTNQSPDQTVSDKKEKAKVKSIAGPPSPIGKWHGESGIISLVDGDQIGRAHV